jgi:ABC-2 type transport system permease protein
VTALRLIRLVAWREIRERVRSKAFLVSSLLSVVVLGIVVLAVGSSDDDGTTYDVGVVGARSTAIGDALGNLVTSDGTGDTNDDGDRPDVEVTIDQVADRAEADRLVTDGDLDAALVDGDGAGDGANHGGGRSVEVIVDDELEGELGALLQAAQREVAITEALEQAGASPDDVAAAVDPAALEVRSLDPGDPDEDRANLAFIGTILLYGQLLGFGFWVASGIVEEKSSRVIELLLAKASPSQMLTGKIVGIGLLGFVQLIAFVAIGLGLAVAVGSIDLPDGTFGVAVEVVAWFVLGFALYACLFAVGGAIASRPEELQATTMPISLMAMAAFFGAVFAAQDPAGTIARVATFIPPAAPLVLPIRTAADEIALWEVALGAALVVATIAVVVPLAARIYAGGALFTRGPLKLRDALARAEE